jgi:hypothetical protein
MHQAVSDDGFFKLNNLKSRNDTDIAAEPTQYNQKQIRTHQKQDRGMVDQRDREPRAPELPKNQRTH